MVMAPLEAASKMLVLRTCCRRHVLLLVMAIISNTIIHNIKLGPSLPEEQQQQPLEHPLWSCVGVPYVVSMLAQ